MKQRLISDIESQMQKVLDNSQLEELHRVLMYCMHDVTIANEVSIDEIEIDYVEMFLAAKKIEGRSEKSLKYYQSTIEKMIVPHFRPGFFLAVQAIDLVHLKYVHH